MGRQRALVKTAGGSRAFGGKWAALGVAVLLAFVCCFVSGCKYSDVLTEHLEDPDIGVLDPNHEPTYESNPDAPERPDLADVSVQESDDENEQVEVLPHYDPNAPDNGPTKQRKKREDTPHDEVASEATESGESDRPTNEEEEDEDEEEDEGDGDAEEEEEPPVDDSEEPGEEEDGADELASDEVEEPGEEETDAGDGGETTIVDPNAPAEESEKGTIAAVGEYATIAQMLGGAGAVVACDQAWLDSCMAKGLFPGELDRVTVAFAGDGTEAGSCDVDLLIDTVKPQVVLWDGTVPALTDEDQARLEEAGITVQLVPTIGTQTTEDYAVRTAVQGVAGALTGVSGLEYDPVSTLEAYLEFHDSVLRTAYDANGGYSYKPNDDAYICLYQGTPLDGLSNSTTTRFATAYIDDLWTPSTSSASINQNATVSEGTIKLAHDGQTLDVSDGVGLSASTNASSYMLIDYYLQLAGTVNTAYDTAAPEAEGRTYIVMPGSTTDFGSSGRFASRSKQADSALFYCGGDSLVPSNWHALGDADFPALLAANNEIAAALAASAAKDDGLYNMEGSYRILVVPTGVAGSWAEGHIDSFLMALWAFQIQDAGSLDVAGEYASAFYSTFFRCADWSSVIGDWNSAYEAP